MADHHDGTTNPSVVKPSCCCSCNTRCLNLSSISFVLRVSSSNPSAHSRPVILWLSILWLNFSSVILVLFFLLSSYFEPFASARRLFFLSSSASELSGVVVSLRPVTWSSPVTWLSPVASGRWSVVSKSAGRRGRRIAADRTFRLSVGGRCFTVEETTALSGRIFTGRIVSYLSGRSVFHSTSTQNTARRHQYYAQRTTTVISR